MNQSIARAEMPLLRFMSPPDMVKLPGLIHIVEVGGPCRTVYLSGQVGFDGTGKLAGEPGDFRSQAVQAFENVKRALAEVGGTFDHVVKVTHFLVDVASDYATALEVRNLYINLANPPASTLVQVVRLARDGLLYELEAIAMLPPR
jgi:enamine deaminase RidA (YjgF/YER057c/UK114 family)